MGGVLGWIGCILVQMRMLSFFMSGYTGLCAFGRWTSCAQLVRSSILNQSGHSSTRAGRTCRLVQQTRRITIGQERIGPHHTNYVSDQQLGQVCLTSPFHTRAWHSQPCYTICRALNSRRRLLMILQWDRTSRNLPEGAIH
jgi:hypothetical protein